MIRMSGHGRTPFSLIINRDVRVLTGISESWGIIHEHCMALGRGSWEDYLLVFFIKTLNRAQCILL